MCEHNIKIVEEAALREAKKCLGLTLALVQGHVLETHGVSITQADNFNNEVNKHVSARVQGICDAGNLGSTC